MATLKKVIYDGTSYRAGIADDTGLVNRYSRAIRVLRYEGVSATEEAWKTLAGTLDNTTITVDGVTLTCVWAEAQGSSFRDGEIDVVCYYAQNPTGIAGAFGFPPDVVGYSEQERFWIPVDESVSKTYADGYTAAMTVNGQVAWTEVERTKIVLRADSSATGSIDLGSFLTPHGKVNSNQPILGITGTATIRYEGASIRSYPTDTRTTELGHTYNISAWTTTDLANASVSPFASFRLNSDRTVTVSAPAAASIPVAPA